MSNSKSTNTEKFKVAIPLFLQFTVRNALNAVSAARMAFHENIEWSYKLNKLYESSWNVSECMFIDVKDSNGKEYEFEPFNLDGRSQVLTGDFLNIKCDSYKVNMYAFIEITVDDAADADKAVEMAFESFQDDTKMIVASSNIDLEWDISSGAHTIVTDSSGEDCDISNRSLYH